MRLLQLRKDSLEPRMIAGDPHASMTTAAMTRIARPTTAGRTTRGGQGLNILGNMSGNLSVSGFKFARNGSSRVMTSTNSTAIAGKKTSQVLNRDLQSAIMTAGAISARGEP